MLLIKLKNSYIKSEFKEILILLLNFTLKSYGLNNVKVWFWAFVSSTGNCIEVGVTNIGNVVD